MENLLFKTSKALKEIGRFEEAKINLSKLVNVSRKHIKKRVDELLNEIINLEKLDTMNRF